MTAGLVARACAYLLLAVRLDDVDFAKTFLSPVNEVIEPGFR